MALAADVCICSFSRHGSLIALSERGVCCALLLQPCLPAFSLAHPPQHLPAALMAASQPLVSACGDYCCGCPAAAACIALPGLKRHASPLKIISNTLHKQSSHVYAPTHSM